MHRDTLRERSEESGTAYVLEVESREEEVCSHFGDARER